MVSAIILDYKEEEVIGHLDAAQLTTLEEYCNNVTNIDPKEKNAFIIGVAMTIPDSDCPLSPYEKNRGVMESSSSLQENYFKKNSSGKEER